MSPAAGTPTRRLAAVATVVGLGALAAGCTGAASGSAVRPLTVLAASSLTDAFAALARGYERARPGVAVRLSFAGSGALAAQVRAGAPADVLATADTISMRAAGRHGVVFARNQLEVAVAPGNPRRIRGLADLARPGLLVAVAAADVPAGRYAAEALRRAGVRARADAALADVRAVLAAVADGEADAGIVYRTDVLAADGTVDGVAVADPTRPAYPIAALSPAGRRFVGYVRSSAGQRVLHRFGFAPP